MYIINSHEIEEPDFQNQINEDFYFIDITTQQRNNKKCWTIISNLTGKEDKIKDFMQKAKRKFSCSGSIDENNNLRFTGDHKNDLSELVQSEFNIKKNRIRLH